MKHFKRLKEFIVLAIVIVLVAVAGAITYKSVFAQVEYVQVEKPAEPVEKNPIKIIKTVCEENGCDWTLCIRVAAGESQFKPYARYINKDKTVDRGIFMFNDYFYKQVDDDCAYDVACATAKFCEEIKKGNLKKWVAAVNLGLVK